MSRTLAHRPERARFDDPSSCVPVHDHRDGPCDLPTLADWFDWVNHGDGEQPWRCDWELHQHLWPKLCGCRLCSGYLELTRFGGHLTSWEDVHDAEGKAAVSA